MDSPSQLNFLPDDYLAAKARARSNRFCICLLALVVSGVSGGFVVANRSLAQLRNEHEAITSEYEREADRIKQFEELRVRQSKLQRRAKLAESLVEKLPRTQVMAEIRSLMPAGTSLLEIALTSKIKDPPPPPPKTAMDQRDAKTKPLVPPEPQPKQYLAIIKLTGVAYTDVQVAQFIGRLSRSPMVSDVNLLLSQQFEHQEEMVRRFEVEINLNDTTSIDFTRLDQDSRLAVTDVQPAR